MLFASVQTPKDVLWIEAGRKDLVQGPGQDSSGTGLWKSQSGNCRKEKDKVIHGVYVDDTSLLATLKRVLDCAVEGLSRTVSLKDLGEPRYEHQNRLEQ